MTTLQIVMLVVWLVIIFGTIFSVGSIFGGAKVGLELCLGLILKVGFFAALAALVYYSLVAISQVFV